MKKKPTLSNLIVKRQISLFLPLILLLQLFGVQNVFAASDLFNGNQKVGVAVYVSQYEKTQKPGDTFSISLGIYNTEFADKKGLRSADITISYDESIFETYENNIWLRSSTSFSVTDPQRLDLDPNDGRKELQFTAKVNGDQTYKTESYIDKYDS